MHKGKIENELTKKELQALKPILDLFELRTLRETGMKNINGGFATADMFNYDDEYVDIELKWGEQDMGSGRSDTCKEQWKLPRKVLLDPKMTVSKCVDSIK